MHLVSVAALYVLMKKDYDQRVEKATHDEEESNNGITLPFDKWVKQVCDSSQLQASGLLREVHVTGSSHYSGIRCVLHVMCLIHSCVPFAMLTEDYNSSTNA